MYPTDNKDQYDTYCNVIKDASSDILNDHCMTQQCLVSKSLDHEGFEYDSNPFFFGPIPDKRLNELNDKQKVYRFINNNIISL